jgi:hypothetical protein
MDKVRNVKLLLYMFEQMAGLKINFEKCEVEGIINWQLVMPICLIVKLIFPSEIFRSSHCSK